MRYSDEDLLRIVGEERKRSIGFGEGDSGELNTAREKALAYARGDMSDVPSLPNRSRAVDTSVADAVETVLPDIMEVFVGGEDVATFVPLSAEDEERAEEESDFVQHVVFTENEGFLALYTGLKDSLLTRTGIFHWWWEEEEKEQVLADGLTQEQANLLAMVQPDAEQEAGEDGSLSLKAKHLHGKVKIRAFPSEDFTVATDTISLRDATYCAVRDRPRVQDLIARGIDAAKARALKPYHTPSEEASQERDRAGESDQSLTDAYGDLRTVEVRDHYIRLDAEGEGKLTIWRITTDAEERVLLDKEEVYQIPFAAVTPYIVPHRFYGESVADKLLEVQRIKTALLRMMLDSGYFALNQRMEVATERANEFTIADLLRNEPNVPVRSKTGDAVRPLSAGALAFDVMGALEFASTIAESRSGIVRNAQGLNPDTLHDTAKGAQALMSAAQKRVRMIARIFAETGIKDLFVGVHCLLRQGYGAEGKTFQPASFKRGKSWSQVQPKDWPERCAMTVHVGVGSAGREHDLIVANKRLELMQAAMQAQAGLEGPILDHKNLHAGLAEWERAAGSKRKDAFWADPSDPQAPKPQPKPDPEMMKAQAELQMKQQEGQANLQLKAQEGEMKAQLDQAAGERDFQLAMAKLDAEMALKREQIASELALKREQLQAELMLKRELGMAQAQVAHETGMAKVNASVSTSDVQPGGDAG